MLHLSPDLEVPIDIVGESTAILAKKGAGKSNTAKVIVEETLDHGGIQVIVLDPIGHWWSLRAGADGKPGGGYPIAVFGGMHGDLPLEKNAGKLLAQTAVESGQSMVLDVSSLDSNGDMQHFVFDLLEELYRLKQATPTPLLLVLEEADEFAPQNTAGPNVPRMVGAANRISKRGRGRGIGMLYVTQRSAALNKNVLDQADTLIVMRTMGPRDRAAIEAWVKYQDAQGIAEILPSLPSLETGEAWFWSPQRDLLRRVKVRKARTYDSSWTPRAGDAKVVVDVKPIDVEGLGKAIAATVERVKANDPAELRKEITSLRRQLADRPAAEPVTVDREVRVEVPIVLNAQARAIVEAATALERVVHDISEALRPLTAAPVPRAPVARPAEAVARPPRASAPPRPPRAEPSANGDVSLNRRAERMVLAVLAQYPEGRSKRQTAILAGYASKGGGFNGALSKLRTLGYIVGSDPLQITQDGLTAIDGQYEPLPEGRALLDHWMSTLNRAAERAVLQVLYDANGEAVDKQTVADRAGYEAAGGGFNGALSKLRTLELIEGSRELRISETLL